MNDSKKDIEAELDDENKVSSSKFENDSGDGDEESENNLSQKLEKAYLDNESIQNKYLRSVADYENLRKRSIREREEAANRARIQIFSDLLPVLDSFKLGLVEAEKTENGKEVAQGFIMAMSQLNEKIKEHGLDIIEEIHVDFDPNIHDAIGYEDCEDHPDGTVLKLIRSGFRLNGNLLRPASVILSRNNSSIS